MYALEEIKKERLDDFRVFLIHVWKHLELPRPTPVQLDIAHYLQHGPDRLVIEAFRGVGKSWITVAYVCWRLFLDPEAKAEVVSASGSLADDFSKFCKQLIAGMPLLSHLTPNRQQGDRDSGISFDVRPARESKDPSVKSVGITGQITGTRADIIVPDDIEVPKNSFTHHLREKLRSQVTEFDSILKPGGQVRYLGTPHTEASLYNHLREHGYTVRVWPAEVPKDPEKYGRNTDGSLCLAPYVIRLLERGLPPGTPVDPDRFDEDELEGRRIAKGRSAYALQFLLDTSPSSDERHPLKLRDLIVHDCDPEIGHVKLVWGQDRSLVLEDLHAGGFDGDRYHRPAFRSPEMAPYSGTVMAIDPSGAGRDETAYAIVKYLHGVLYLVDVGGFQAGFAEETLKALAAAAARHNVNHVVDEPNYGGGMFSQLLKPHLAKYAGKAGTYDDEWVQKHGWSRGQKELRILDTLEPVVHSHRLVVDRRVLEEDIKVQGENKTNKFSFVQQFTRISRDRGALQNDDRIEAVAMACQYWVDKMARDQDKAVERHKEEKLMEELRGFRSHVFSLGMRTPGRGWRR